MPKLIKLYIFIIISLLCCSCAQDDLLQWKTLKANLKQAKVQQTKLQESSIYTHDLELDYEYYINNKKYADKKFVYLSTKYSEDSAFDYSLQEIENSNSLYIEYSQLFPHISRFEPEWIKTKAKIILAPEESTINIVSEKEFKVINYPQVYYEYSINNQVFL